MNNLKKITAFLLVIIMTLLMGACAHRGVATKNKEWGYKANDNEYSIGTYLLPKIDAYRAAYGYLSYYNQDLDLSGSILDVESSFDESGQVYTVREWMDKQAEDYIKYMVAVDFLMEKHGVTLADGAESDMYEEARLKWHYGDVQNIMNGYTEAEPLKDIYEPCGVSFDSYFQSAYMLDLKYDAIFARLYATDGERAIDKKEMADYFEKNYTHYSFCMVDLYEPVYNEVTGETVNTPFDDYATNDIKSTIDSYANRLNEGETLDKIKKEFAAFAMAEDEDEIFIERTESYADVTTSISEDVRKVLENLGDNQAQIIYTGQEDTPIAIFVYKHPVSEVTEENLADDTTYRLLAAELKGEEFFEYLKEVADDMEYEVNEDVLGGFTAEFIEDNYRKYLDSFAQ